MDCQSCEFHELFTAQNCHFTDSSSKTEYLTWASDCNLYSVNAKTYFYIYFNQYRWSKLLDKWNKQNHFSSFQLFALFNSRSSSFDQQSIQFLYSFSFLISLVFVLVLVNEKESF